MRIGDAILVIYAPLERLIVYLAAGWRPQLVVEPMPMPHGLHSILLWRPDGPPAP